MAVIVTTTYLLIGSDIVLAGVTIRANKAILSNERSLQVNTYSPTPLNGGMIPTPTGTVWTASVSPTPSPPTPTPTSIQTPVRATINLATPIAARTPLPDRIKVPILMYHYIRINPVSSDIAGYNLSVTPQNFRQQVEWLSQNGYHSISFEQLLAYFHQQRPLPSKPVILTFDDGYRDFYTEAFPVLKSNSQTGTVFVITGFVDREQYLRSDQIIELAHEGIEFGGHTARHPDVRGISGATAAVEITASKRALDTLVGRHTVAFSYPAGGFNEWAIGAIKSSGYKAAVTTREGAWHSGKDLFTLSRLRVSGSTTLDTFIKKIEAP